MKRDTAYKLRIGDINSGNPDLDGKKLNFVKVGDKEIRRVNIAANIIDKFERNEEGKKYASLTIDDASGQIRIKMFGDDVEKFNKVGQGDTVIVIGRLRHFNNEVYILPEIIKKKDPRYLLIRKLENKKNMPKEVKKKEAIEIKDKIIEKIKEAEKDEGIHTDKLARELNVDQDIIDEKVKKLIEEGLIYEPSPGKLRWLG